jgi:hypothetical protein
MNISLPDEHSVVIDGRAMTFEREITHLVTLADRVILRFQIDDFAAGDVTVGRNILCLGADGKPLWRIADHGKSMYRGENSHGRDPRDVVPRPFLSLAPRQGEIVANIPGEVYAIDPETGNLSEPRPYM